MDDLYAIDNIGQQRAAMFQPRCVDNIIISTAAAGRPRAGVYPLTAAGLSAKQKVLVQTDTAINDTDLRDATGDIAFGGKKQIEDQDAGAGINRIMAVQIPAPIGTANLTGQIMLAGQPVSFANANKTRDLPSTSIWATGCRWLGRRLKFLVFMA